MERRSPNFTVAEIDFLLAAVRKRSMTIESKKIGRAGSEEKYKTWKIIEREFNRKFTDTFRPYKVLKNKYGNMKAIAKQHYALDKQQMSSTSSVPPPPPTTTKTDKFILQICLEAQKLGTTSSRCDANEEDEEKESCTFNNKEIKYLIQLVDKRKEIIEAEETYQFSEGEKNKAWMEIEKEFNACFNVNRSSKILELKYKTFKQNVGAKFPSSDLSNHMLLEILDSNENSVINEPLSDSDLDLSEEKKSSQAKYISDVDMKPVPSLNEEELDAAAEQYVFETLLLDETQTFSQNSEHNDIRRSPEATPVKTGQKKKSDTVDVWEEVGQKKLKKLELEMQIIEEEWALRKQKLELEVENVRIDNRLKKELLKEKLENSNRC